MKTFRIALDLVCCALLAGCSVSVTQLTVRASPSPIPTTPATLHVQPTPTPIEPPSKPAPSPTKRPTPSPRPRPSATPEPIVLTEEVPVCQGEGQPSQPARSFGIDGAIVYQKDRQGLYTIGGAPLTRSQLPVDQNREYAAFGFSPDGKWLAYSPVAYSPEAGYFFDTFTIDLLSNTGEQIEHLMDVRGFLDELPEGERFEILGTFLSYWIDDRLIYTHMYGTDPGSAVSGPPSSLPKVFDPFTGDWHLELTDDMPDRKVGEAIGFSPDLTRALYASNYRELILWDLERQAVIWEDWDFKIEWFATISWSPDGSMVAASNGPTNKENRRLLLVSDDGAKVRIIGGGDYPFFNFWPDRFTWSPNSQYLAVTDDVKQLYLYDTKTNHYLYRCPIPGSDFGPDELVWSPDSRFIAFGGRDMSLRVLEVKTGEVTTLLPDGIPVGWSATFPVQWP
jgi:WD40 repeat protein